MVYPNHFKIRNWFKTDFEAHAMSSESSLNEALFVSLYFYISK